MDLVIDALIKFGPATCGLLAIVIQIGINCFRRRENNLFDLYVAGTAGSAIPIGVLLIYSAFDGSIMTELTATSYYNVFVGTAILFVSFRTLTEKVQIEVGERGPERQGNRRSAPQGTEQSAAPAESGAGNARHGP